MESKRTQADRTAATRAALVAAARPLFAAKGFAAVSTDEVASAAGVTRGALYHQFGGKEDLFAAVFEQVEAEIVEQLAALLAGADDDPVAALRAGIDGWLTVCAEPEINRIVLVEAPAALGWERWREIVTRHGLGLVEAALQSLMDAGLLAVQPVAPLAHVLGGALDEAALYAARAEDRERATAEVREALHAVLDGMVRR